MIRALVLLLILGVVPGTFAAQPPQGADANWPQFRGLGARGVGLNHQLPEKWSATENVAWKRDIPGRSWSSPIVWGDNVFVATVISSSEMEPAKKGLYLGGERPNSPRPEHDWKLLCLDLDSGAVKWERQLHHGAPAQPVHLKNTYASETPVTDGERVFVYMGNVGVFAVNFDGRIAWSKSIQPQKTRYGWGPAASPVLHRDKLYLVNDNDEHSYLLALDKTTGQEVWRTDRDEKSNWSTPFVWENSRRAEIVTAGTGAVRSYDLDGKLLWSLKGMSSITIATPYADGDLLYVTSGFIVDKTRPVYAIRPGASGDISLEPGQTNNASIAWCQPLAAPYNPSTLVYDHRLYVLYDRGEVSAFNALTGGSLFTREKLPNGLHFTVSPWASNGRVFCLNEDGVAFVLRGGDGFELLRTNRLADDDMCMATPALVGDRLLIRTSVRLYCIRNSN